MTSIGVDVREGAHGPGVIGGLLGAVMGRMATAEEQAAAIVWLASDAASNVNGVVLPVDDAWAAV